MSEVNARGLILIQYGLAGIVIYIFYQLIRNDLKELRNEMRLLREVIYELVVQLKQRR